MKKIILGLVSLLALTTSCSKHEIEPMSVQQMKDAEYEVAFTNVFGDYDKTHDWGFSRASVAQTRTADVNSNEWTAKGYNVPSAITEREREVVMKWFRTHENPQSETVDLHNYFIQNVGYTDHTYTAGPDNNGHTVTITNPGTSHMDWIFVGPGANENGAFTWNEGDDHINNFNASSGEIQHMMYSGSEWFGFHDSYGTGYSTPGHGDNGKYCAVNRNFVIRFIDVDGVIGCYVGFNYESGKTSEKWHLDPDGFFDDRVIKLVAAEGEIVIPPIPPTLVEYGRVICEDLADSQGSDFDFNDVVFDAYVYSDGSCKIVLQAAGGTMPLTVGGHEVHNEFGGYPVKTMINTHAEKRTHGEYANNVPPKEFTINGISSIIEIPIYVNGGTEVWEITAPVGKAPQKLCVPITFQWCEERVSIKDDYPLFSAWVLDKSLGMGWATK